MITLLSRWFIKDNKNYSDPLVRRQYGILCGLLGIVLNIVLCVFKMLAGAISGSIAITADALNNLSDAGSSLVALVGVRLSGQKPDREHPFGHGRVEYVSAFIVAMLIIVVGVELFKSSVGKIISPTQVEFSWVSFAILTVSVLIKLYMFFYNFGVGKKIDSSIAKATAIDSVSDCTATFAVLICMVVGELAQVNIDGWCGVAVSAFIIFAGIKTGKDTVTTLLGSPADKKFVSNVEDIVLSYSDVCGMHDLVVHDYGPGRLMISLHVEVSAQGDMLTMHDMVDNIERELSEKMCCEAVIHMDPIVNDDTTLSNRKLVEEAVALIDPRITLHDFRMVVGNTHTNLIFDMVVPFDCKLDEKALKHEVQQLVAQRNETFFTVVQIDRTLC